MSTSRWAPKPTGSVPVPATPPADLPAKPLSPPSSKPSARPTQQRYVPPTLRNQPAPVTTLPAAPVPSPAPTQDASQEVPKKVNTWDKYKYKPELDVPITFNENAKVRERPSRLANVPKHDAKGLTGAAASRWAPKHVVDEALKRKQEEEKSSLTSDEEGTTTSTMPTSVASVESKPAHSVSVQRPEVENSTMKENVKTAESPASKADPQDRQDNLLTTFKTVNAERTSPPSHKEELPSLLSRMSIPPSQADPKEEPETKPKAQDPWLIKSFSRPETGPSTPSTPTTMNWADEDEDDEEDLKALMAREWGAASVAKIEEKSLAPAPPAPRTPDRGVSIRGQASRAAPSGSTPNAGNQGVELFPETKPSPSRGQTSSPRRARPQIAAQSDAFARLSRGFMGGEGGQGGAGARTRGKRAGKELIKEPAGQ